MGSVDIGIGHDDDLVVSGPTYIEVGSQARTDRIDDRLKLVVALDLVLSGFLDVEHLSPER